MTLKHPLIALLLAATLLTSCAATNKPQVATPPATAQPRPVTPSVAGLVSQAGFIDAMVAEHGFARADLEKLFTRVQRRPRIIQIMTAPAEAKPWYKYRPIFVNEASIEGGVAFWNTHAADLARAERDYGVPPEIIVAIIGVETRYGGNMGSFPVIDALATLAFDYPPRAPFFRSELEHFLLLAREEGFDPLAPKGSYAGAMGEAQFMPSSYRNFSVDYDADGRRDLWRSHADAIGSVANYFKAHGWQPGRPVISRARAYGDGYRTVQDEKLTKPQRNVAQFKDAGVVAEDCLDDAQPAMLVRLENTQAEEFWLGLDNFYVITRYNHSHRYAMAVYQLSREILARRQ